MKEIVIRYGLLASLILCGIMATSLPLCLSGVISWEYQEIAGYSSMILAFLMVFLGIRSYREKVAGGSITFGKAFKVGILITLVTAGFYVAIWEVVYWNFLPDFEKTYAEHVIQKKTAEGASAAEIAKTRAQMESFQKWYKNPFLNVAFTFLEVFPIGLLMTLISAAILRRRGPGTVQPAMA